MENVRQKFLIRSFVSEEIEFENPARARAFHWQVKSENFHFDEALYVDRKWNDEINPSYYSSYTYVYYYKTLLMENTSV